MAMKVDRSWSISSKLWIAMTLLILVVLGGLGLTITWLFGHFYLQQKLNSLQTDATEISERLVAIPSWGERLKLIETLKLTSGIQLVILDTQGTILVISGSSSLMPQVLHDGIEGHLGGMIGGLSRDLRPSDFFNEDYLAQVLSGKAISIEAQLGGGQTMRLAATPVGTKPVQEVVLLGSSPIPMHESIATFRWLIFYASLIAVFLATAIEWLE